MQCNSNQTFQTVDIDYDKMDIEGQLEAKVDMKPPVKVPVKIEGGFTIAYKDHEVDNLNETTIRV